MMIACWRIACTHIAPIGVQALNASTPPCLTSDNPAYGAHGLALRNEMRTWGVVRQGEVLGTGIIGTTQGGMSIPPALLADTSTSQQEDESARCIQTRCVNVFLIKWVWNSAHRQRPAAGTGSSVW
jgi:hypothetical protein